MNILPDSLKPYQQTGAELIVEFNCTRLLADEMGVGKTRTAAAAVIMADRFPCIVVCPVQVKYTWADEIAAICPEAKVSVISGRSPSKCPIVPGFHFYVINRDIFAARLEELKALNPRQLIKDEAHQIGGYDTAILKALFLMSAHVRKVGGGILPLTGTPITNDYTDIHRIFCIMAPGVFGNKTAFEAKYCPENVYKKKIFGGMFSGKPRWMVAKEYADAKKQGLVPRASEASIAELSKIIRQWWLRRTRKSVWKVIPHETHMWRVDVDDAEVMEADKEARKSMSEGGISNEGEFMHIRRLIAEAKIPLVIQWIHNLLSQTDEKLIVMRYHTEVEKALKKEFGKMCVSISGDGIQKKAAERAFQTDPSVRLCVAHVKASTGVTLTAARTTLFAELPWTHADLKQDMDRNNRIGQEAEYLDYTICIAADTVEEIVWRIVNRKKDLTAKVMGE
jgi:SWI/SNF-related matrix-associated actin-dependent regulator 1 of chromatin subfamily A